MVRSNSDASLGQLVNTEVSQFICQIVDWGMALTCEMFVRVTYKVPECSSKVFSDAAESYRGGRKDNAHPAEAGLELTSHCYIRQEELLPCPCMTVEESGQSVVCFLTQWEADLITHAQ